MEHALTSDDIFKEDAFEFDRIAKSLFDNKMDNWTVGYTLESNPRYALEMYKLREESNESVGYGGVDPASGKYVVTYSKMKVNIYPKI